MDVSALDGGGMRLAARAALASAVLAATGVAFLLAMFASFAIGATSVALLVGRLNDILVMVAYPLAVPAILAMWALVRPHRRILGGLAAALAIAAVAAIAALQLLLVVEALSFEEQVGPVSVALLAFGIALVLLGYAGRSSGVLPGGLRMGLIAATYFGFPFWARWAARRLERPIVSPDAASSAPHPASPTTTQTT